MKYYSIASGSKGNCFVVQSNKTTLVIDCGSTKKHLTRNFHNIDVKYEQVDALLITHGHSDHIGQIKMFWDIPTYSPIEIEDKPKLVRIRPYQPFIIQGVRVLPIALSHDSGLTVGYIIDDGLEKLVYITDTGYIRDSELPILKGADYYILESNHDPDLLMQTRRPFGIKTRILSDNGHLSNHDSAEILSKVVTLQTKEIVLAHLSAEANTHDLAYQTVYNKLQTMGAHIVIRVAKQDELLVGGL